MKNDHKQAAIDEARANRRQKRVGRSSTDLKQVLRNKVDPGRRADAKRIVNVLLNREATARPRED